MSKAADDALYRKAALVAHRAPERLDRRVQLIGRGTWMALAVLYATIGGAIVWSIIGSIPTYVSGNGILINTGGAVVQVLSPAAGIVGEIDVSVGDTVQAGQTLATLTRKDLATQLRNALQAQSEAADDEKRAERDIAQAQTARHAANQRRQSALQQQAQSSRQRESEVAAALANDEALLKQGMTTLSVVLQARSDRAQAAQAAAQAAADLAQLEQQEAEASAQDARTLSNAAQGFSDARRKVAELETSTAITTVFTAPAAGRITEVLGTREMSINNAQPLFAIETGSEGLEAMIFVDPQQGKQVKPGQEVRLEAGTAKKEEYGTVQGTVTWISAFPSSTEGMRSILQNDDLAHTFSAKGPPFAVRVRLTPDSSTVSGYRWTSEKGRLLALSSGTLMNGSVVTERQAPITLVLPLLRKITGLD
jgi:HlyD family secretion protein